MVDYVDPTDDIRMKLQRRDARIKIQSTLDRDYKIGKKGKRSRTQQRTLEISPDLILLLCKTKTLIFLIFATREERENKKRNID